MNKPKVECSIGPHLILNCFGCPIDKLTDKELIFNTLSNFPALLNMTTVFPPYVFKYNGDDPNESGLSGVVLIPESHITIHTFPEKKHVFIDIFSRKEFDTSFAANHMIELFNAENHDIQISSRGMDFPSDMMLVREAISLERKLA